jgi:hypothetical protein
LASLADAYVNDAFGTSHRAHASVAGVPALMNVEVCGLGLLVSSELAYLDFSSKAEGEIIAASKCLFFSKYVHQSLLKSVVLLCILLTVQT